MVLVEFWNGQRYDDSYTCVVGVFSSQELADEAGKSFVKSFDEAEEGCCYTRNIEMNEVIK